MQQKAGLRVRNLEDRFVIPKRVADFYRNHFFPVFVPGADGTAAETAEASSSAAHDGRPALLALLIPFIGKEGGREREREANTQSICRRVGTE